MLIPMHILARDFFFPFLFYDLYMHCLIITKAQASWIMHETLSMSFAGKNGTKKLRECKNERKIFYFFFFLGEENLERQKGELKRSARSFCFGGCPLLVENFS